MEDHQAPFAVKAALRSPWNKGKLVGAKPPLRPSHVWFYPGPSCRWEGRKRDLALFNLAIHSKLRDCDVVAVRVDDVAPSGTPGTGKHALHLRTSRVMPERIDPLIAMQVPQRVRPSLPVETRIRSPAGRLYQGIVIP